MKYDVKVVRMNNNYTNTLNICNIFSFTYNVKYSSSLRGYVLQKEVINRLVDF
jgi:hypothetical protein